MLAITHAELIQKLLDLKGANPITFTAKTDSRSKIKNNPWLRPIWKINRVNGLVNFHYDQGVLRRLDKEGKSPDDFRRGTSWHEPVILNGRLTPLCTSKNPANSNVYVRFMFVQRIGDPRYTDAKGCSLTYEQVKPFLPNPSSYENQGLDKPLIFLTYDIANLLSVTVGGESYDLVEQVALAS